MDKQKEEEVVRIQPLGSVKATGLKSVEVKARDTISIRGQVISEMQASSDTYFADRYFCEKHHVTNQQINQMMKALLIDGSIIRDRPQVADPYGTLPPGKRIMNRWK